MKRREFITLLGGAAAAWPLAARAQQRAMPIFGILLIFSRESGQTFTEPLRAYMHALGYVDGRNIAFDVRYADGKVERGRTRCEAAGRAAEPAALPLRPISICSGYWFVSVSETKAGWCAGPTLDDDSAGHEV